MAVLLRPFLRSEGEQSATVERTTRKGGEPIAIIPRLQMSTFGPYSFRVTTSGAIQYGVPTIVVRLAFSVRI